MRTSYFQSSRSHVFVQSRQASTLLLFSSNRIITHSSKNPNFHFFFFNWKIPWKFTVNFVWILGGVRFTWNRIYLKSQINSPTYQIGSEWLSIKKWNEIHWYWRALIPVKVVHSKMLELISSIISKWPRQSEVFVFFPLSPFSKINQWNKCYKSHFPLAQMHSQSIIIFTVCLPFESPSMQSTLMEQM